MSLSRQPHPVSESQCKRRHPSGQCLTGAALWMLLMQGCAVGPSYRPQHLDTPQSFKEIATAASVSSADIPAQWWQLFNDPVLNQLEGQVQVSNQNLLAAQAAYREAVTVVSEQRAAFFPALALNLQGSRTDTSSDNGTVTTTNVGGGSVSTRSPETYQANVGARWELDLWGRLRRSLENARALADASAGDLAFATLSLQGQLAIVYLQLREADAEQRLLAETTNAYARSLQIAQNRYTAGAAPKTDLLQAQSQLASAQDQAVALALQRAQFEHAIAALTGNLASRFELAAQADWQPTVPEVPAGVPSTLLQRRPDIVAAERRVAAANASIGIQEAAYFPTLTLTGTYAFFATSVANLFSSNQTNSGAASAATTLFDAGATRARVAGARAAHDQAIAKYRQTVLEAFRNVEDQLASGRLLAQQYELRRQASQASDEAERMAMNQYLSGTVSYTNVIVAQASALSARRALAAISLSRQTAVVSLITNLGGGWDGSSQSVSR